MAKLTTTTKKTPIITNAFELAIAAHRALSQNTGKKNHLVLEAYENLFTAVWALPTTNIQREPKTDPTPIRSHTKPISGAPANALVRKTAPRAHRGTERRTYLAPDTFASRLHLRIMNQAHAVHA